MKITCCKLKLSQLTKAQVIEWRQELLIDKSRSMASKTIRALSAILNNAMEIGAISQNVVSDVKVGRAKRARRAKFQTGALGRNSLSIA